MKTIEDFLNCDLFNNYDHVEVRDYDNDSVIIERMTIKELFNHFHDTENYLADEFELMHIYCGNCFRDTVRGIYRGYIILLVRYTENYE